MVAPSNSQAADGARWRPHRVWAAALSVPALLLPVVAAGGAAYFAGHRLGRPEGLPGVLWWLGLVLAAACATVVVVDRAVRRLRPLSRLLRLSLAFPGVAPSRWAVARGRTTSHGETPGYAAEQVLALVLAMDEHDPRSRGHAVRVHSYADLIAADLGLSADERAKLGWAALAHDLGKLEVSSALLATTAPPTGSELAILRRHPARAAALPAPLRRWLGEWLDGVSQHHERIDGTGYPDGLHGEQIHLAARIVAVADAYDVMTSPRSYRKLLPVAEARHEVARGSGTQFDPLVVRALLHVSHSRMRGVAGFPSRLARVPAAAWVLTGQPAPRIVGSLGIAAVVAAASLGWSTLPVTSGSPAAEASRLWSTNEPSPGSTGGRSGQNHTTAGGAGSHDEGDDGADDSDDGERSDELGGKGPFAAAPGSLGTTDTTDQPEGDGSGRTTSTTDPDSPTTTTDPADPTTTTVPPSTTTTQRTNSPPSAGADSATVTGLSTTSIDVLANDVDDDGLDPSTLTITSGPGPGSATVSGGRIRYTAPERRGSARIGYRICDSDGACDTATLNITITAL